MYILIDESPDKALGYCKRIAGELWVPLYLRSAAGQAGPLVFGVFSITLAL